MIINTAWRRLSPPPYEPTCFGKNCENYPSDREASLFGDNIPVAVYDNLIERSKKTSRSSRVLRIPQRNPEAG